MSATVPSWLFAMTEKHQDHFGKDLAAAAATEVAATAHRILISAAGLGFNHPALGANAYPEVTHLFCRLPLVTFPHGPEAIHLGVLMRIRYGPGARKEVDLRRSFHEDRQGSVRYKNCIAFSMFSDAFHQLKCHSRRQQRQREKKTLHGPAYPISFVIAIKQTNHIHQPEAAMHHPSWNQAKALTWQSFPCPIQLKFPVLSRIKPHNPRLVVVLRQFL